MSIPPVFRWRPNPLRYGAWHNFGDSLFVLIAERIAGRPVSVVGKHHRGPKLLAGGSVIDTYARDGDIVWGAGLRLPDRLHASTLDVRAVRGPLTREALRDRWNIECPPVYGDPAQLTPRLFPEWRPHAVPGRVGLVPHLARARRYPRLPHHVRLIDPLRHPDRVIPEILECELIVSGSLHGLILAEAFGIPARWFPDGGPEPSFKFHDFYASTGRVPRPADTLAAALDMRGQEPGRFPDSDGLMAACPLRKGAGGIGSD